MLNENFSEPNKLDYNQAYRCPVCRHGEISNITLMDAFACNFCHHIFTANLEQQTLKMADSQLGLTWYWDGRKWRNVQQKGQEITGNYWWAGLIFILLPTILVGSAVYLFPPLPGSRLAWFPWFWVILTFTAHSLCLLWLVIEYYQFPLGRYIAVLSRNLGNRLLTLVRE